MDRAKGLRSRTRRRARRSGQQQRVHRRIGGAVALRARVEAHRPQAAIQIVREDRRPAPATTARPAVFGRAPACASSVFAQNEYERILSRIPSLDRRHLQGRRSLGWTSGSTEKANAPNASCIRPCWINIQPRERARAAFAPAAYAAPAAYKARPKQTSAPLCGGCDYCVCGGQPADAAPA